MYRDPDPNFNVTYWLANKVMFPVLDALATSLETQTELENLKKERKALNNEYKQAIKEMKEETARVKKEYKKKRKRIKALLNETLASVNAEKAEVSELNNDSTGATTKGNNE